jgi:MFS family permease
LLLSFLISIHAVVISALYFFLPIYLAGALSFSGAQIGLLYGVLGLNSLLAAFPMGVVGDRYPARILTRLGLVGTAANLWGLAHAEHFWPFFLLFFGFGLSLQLYRQSLDIMLFKEGDIRGNTRRFGAYNAWRMGGMAAGILLGGISLYFLSYPKTFQLLAALLLLILALTWRLPLTRGQQSPLLQYGRDFLSGPVLFFVTWLFLFTMHWGAEGTSLGLFLKNDLGLSTLGMGLYLAGEFTMVATTAYLYGRYGAGRLSPFALLALALATSGLGHIPELGLVLCLAPGARLRRRPHRHDHLHHHRPPVPRGPHRRQRRPDFPGHHHGRPRRLPPVRSHGRLLGLCHAAHRLRPYLAGPHSSCLHWFEGTTCSDSDQ